MSKKIPTSRVDRLLGSMGYGSRAEMARLGKARQGFFVRWMALKGAFHLPKGGTRRGRARQGVAGQAQPPAAVGQVAVGGRVGILGQVTGQQHPVGGAGVGLRQIQHPFQGEAGSLAEQIPLRVREEVRVRDL